jgi:outer membrane protein insertion porin family
MIKNSLSYIVFICFSLVFVSCTGTKHLAEDEYLARNGKIVFIEKEKIKEFGEIRVNLAQQAEVNHNNKFFWMRPRLSFHNAIKEPKKDKGFKYWLKYKVGKAPVIYNSRQTERIARSLKTELFNHSYFNAEVKYDIVEKRFQKQAVYRIKPGHSYKIGSIQYTLQGKSEFDSEIRTIIENHKTDARGRTYTLNSLIDGRKRFANNLMNNGYYYFRPDYFEFIADTTLNGRYVDLQLQLKPKTPGNAYNKYSINEVFIEDNFYFDSIFDADTQLVNKLYYLSPEQYINPRVVANTVHIQPGNLYNREDHLKTLNHIRSLQVYKFVNIAYIQDDSLSNKLNARLTLVPLSKMSFSGELNANFKSNNFAGPGILFSFTNRNTFKGAELLNIGFGGRFETQIGQGFRGNTSYEVRLDGSLQLPRLYPFKSKRIEAQNVPTTAINLGGGLQERTQWYRMVNWNTSLGYTWKHSEKVSHRVSPIDINLSNLLHTTEQFRDYLESNPSVRRSFEEQFILGMNYDFFYTSSPDRLNTPFFLGITLDLSGNLLSGIFQLMGNPPPDSDTPYKLFNSPYAQYFRTVVDVRRSFTLWPNNVIATRLNISGGIPYGNSEIMPYIKQFYVGGANSLRGFAARSVGPGTYKLSEEETAYIDQAADLKLEMNLEYRFPLWGILHSAVFTDIGNIWLVNEDESRPGGRFNANTFINELAVSSGIGLRISIDPIIVRFDWAWPMRYPYPIENSHWVIDDINFSSYDWRKKNLILNISLGYPF